LTAQQWFERGYSAIDTDERLRCYSEAIRLKPDYIDAFFNRGLALQQIAFKSGDKSLYKSAISDYQTYLDLGGGLRNGDQSPIEQTIRHLVRKI
jgi:tetratricopeptide (TPR) repeat protein